MTQGNEEGRGVPTWTGYSYAVSSYTWRFVYLTSDIGYPPFTVIYRDVFCVVFVAKVGKYFTDMSIRFVYY